MEEGTSAATVKEKSILDELAHSETVRKLIECPVCLELPLPPIYVCNKGHIVCNNCQARTYACPLCREHYSTTRGFVAEGIIEKCILRCKHADQGCPLSMRGSAMVEHIEYCDYRPVKCVDCAGKLVNFDEYEDHLLKHHRINGINQNRAYVIYSMNLAHQIAFGEKCCWPQYYLKAFDNVTFLLRLYATHWFVCAWVSLLGPKSECAKYEALLEFHPTSDNSVVHTWQGPVNHFRSDPAKEIFLQGRGLITPMETLMQMAPVANDHAEWLYNIEILPANANESEEAPLNNDEENLADTTSTSEAPTATQMEEKTVTTTESGVSQPIDHGDDQMQVTSPLLATVTAVQQTSSDSSPKPRVPKSPARLVCEAPSQLASPGVIRTPRRRSSNGNIVTSGPITMSPSSSVLTRETVQSPSTQNQSSPFSMQTYGSDINQGPVTVSTARASSRILSGIRRNSPLSFFLRESSSNYGLTTEEEWDISSDSDEEE